MFSINVGTVHSWRQGLWVHSHRKTGQQTELGLNDRISSKRYLFISVCCWVSYCWIGRKVDVNIKVQVLSSAKDIQIPLKLMEVTGVSSNGNSEGISTSKDCRVRLSSKSDWISLHSNLVAKLNSNSSCSFVSSIKNFCFLATKLAIQWVNYPLFHISVLWKALQVQYWILPQHLLKPMERLPLTSQRVRLSHAGWQIFMV